MNGLHPVDVTIDFYPWLVDWRTVVEIFAGGLATILGLYLWLRSGREPWNSGEPGNHPPVRSFAGIIRMDSNRCPAFIYLWIIFLVVWTIGYLVQTSLHGLNY